MIAHGEKREDGREAVLSPGGEAEEARQRASVYGLLASLFRNELTTEGIERLRRPPMADSLSEMGVDFGPEFASEPVEKLQEMLAVEFNELFLLPGFLISPHESVQTPGGKGLLRGPETTQVAEYFKVVGFNFDEKSFLEPDHISVELEFLQHLSEQEAIALEQEGDVQSIRRYQEDFLTRHLARWCYVFLTKVAEGTNEAFYREIAHLTADFLRSEQERLAELNL